MIRVRTGTSISRKFVKRKCRGQEQSEEAHEILPRSSPRAREGGHPLVIII